MPKEEDRKQVDIYGFSFIREVDGTYSIYQDQGGGEDSTVLLTEYDVANLHQILSRVINGKF